MTFIKYKKSHIRKRKKKVDKDRATTVAASSYLAHVNNPNHSSKDINACLSYLEHLGPFVVLQFGTERQESIKGAERKGRSSSILDSVSYVCYVFYYILSALTFDYTQVLMSLE